MFEINVIGNLTRNPQLRTVNTTNGARNVCDFDIAVNETRGGETKTTYVRVSVWNGTNANGNGMADNCAKWLATGRKVFVSGRPSINMYTSNKDNQTHAQMQIAAQTVEFLSPRNGEATAQPANQARTTAAPNYDAPTENNVGFETVNTDELPF